MSPRTTNALLLVNAALAALLALDLILPLGRDTAAHADPPAAVPEILRARQIELVARDGKVVAQLYAGEDGGGNLRLRSGSGEVRVKLGATSDGAGLVLMDAATSPAIQLAASPAATTITLARAGKEARVLQP